MSKIDLDRLRVRQIYLIPIESSKLKTAVLEELRASEPEIDGLYAWNLAEEHKLSFRFFADLCHSFVCDSIWGMTAGTKEFRNKIKEALNEFKEGGSDSYRAEIERLYADSPLEIYVSIRRIEENACLCKVECTPSLAEKLRILEDIQTNEFELQNSYLSCKRFLETVFEGGLSATLVEEEKMEPLRERTQMLINDEASHQIFNKIVTMLDEATGEVLICGWVGTILLPKLKDMKQKGINIRIITHKSAELKGKPGRRDVERAHQELIALLGEENISMNPECHFRALVVDSKALVGSMDFNATSLTGTHREFAIYTEIPEIVRSIRNYFNQIFTPLSE